MNSKVKITGRKSALNSTFCFDTSVAKKEENRKSDVVDFELSPTMAHELLGPKSPKESQH